MMGERNWNSLDQDSSTPVCTFNKKQTNTQKTMKPKTVEKIPTVLWLLAFVTFPYVNAH